MSSDDDTCPWCNQEITPDDTITITPLGHMHAACAGVYSDDTDEAPF